MNRHFALYPELLNLLRKVKKLPDDLLVKQLKRISNCKLIAVTGIFVGKPRIETDILFVGKIKPSSISRSLALAEKFAEQEVGYTILSPQEFDYRKTMNDRFVKNVLENQPVLVVDKIK
jgi:hypothetical protein